MLLTWHLYYNQTFFFVTENVSFVALDQKFVKTGKGLGLGCLLWNNHVNSLLPMRLVAP